MSFPVLLRFLIFLCVDFSRCMFSLTFSSGSHLLSRIVSNTVPSAAQVLTFVFGMGTGVSLKRIATGNFAIKEVRFTRFKLRLRFALIKFLRTKLALTSCSAFAKCSAYA